MLVCARPADTTRFDDTMTLHGENDDCTTMAIATRRRYSKSNIASTMFRRSRVSGGIYERMSARCPAHCSGRGMQRDRERDGAGFQRLLPSSMIGFAHGLEEQQSRRSDYDFAQNRSPAVMPIVIAPACRIALPRQVAS